MVFGLGMGLLALMEFGNFMALIQLDLKNVLFWKRISLLGECLLPAVWLVFSLNLAKKHPRDLMKEWKMILIGMGVVSVFFMILIPLDVVVTHDSLTFLPLDRIGQTFYIFLLLGYVVIVGSLENTIRQLKGEQRTRFKYLILGIGGIFAFLIFVTTKALLYSGISMRMVPVSSSVFIICTAMIAFSIGRQQLMDVNISISRSAIYKSVTLLVVGGYLILVGLMSQAFRSFHIVPGYPFEVLFIFAAILIPCVVFLSNRIRWKARTLISRHFYRRRYDYREEWFKFADGLSRKLDLDELILPIINMLQDTVGVNEVSLWLNDTSPAEMKLSRADNPGEHVKFRMDQKFFNILLEKKEPFSMDTPWSRVFVRENRDLLEQYRVSLVVPLVSAREMVGVIFFGEKTTGEKFLLDDIDLLRSVAAQIASAIKNAKLSQELIKVKEMEVFHRFSSFVLHDLKNLVSSLSLVVQNADEHMSDRDFQRDTVETIGKSVEKMGSLISKLSNGAASVTPDLQETDLNRVVSDVVSQIGHNGPEGKTLQMHLVSVPSVLADRQQMEKVIMNLLVNAFEAVGKAGQVMVKTGADNNQVMVAVSDNGCGMSPDYVRNALFKPFMSTKKKGLGIGLYQCQTIVKAHEGRIEVETEEGVGSTFRVVLPVKREQR